ncbi:hypothetical protein ACHAW6_011168 [Cyclotella cf. meneghiniana]
MPKRLHQLMFVAVCCQEHDEGFIFKSTIILKNIGENESIVGACCKLTKGGKESNVVDASFISRVTGTDISFKALNGALVSWDKSLDRIHTTFTCLTNQFLCSRWNITVKNWLGQCNNHGRNWHAYYDRDIKRKEPFGYP